MSDSSLGIPSQCLATENLNKQQRKYDQYCANLAMKINAKLGGVNQVASLPHSQTPSLGIACLEQEPFIIFGAQPWPAWSCSFHRVGRQVKSCEVDWCRLGVVW